MLLMLVLVGFMLGLTVFDHRSVGIGVFVALGMSMLWGAPRSRDRPEPWNVRRRNSSRPRERLCWSSIRSAHPFARDRRSEDPASSNPRLMSPRHTATRQGQQPSTMIPVR